MKATIRVLAMVGLLNCSSRHSASTRDGVADSVVDSGVPDLSKSSERLCDGTATLRLRVFKEAINGREARGSIVRVENGVPSFFVDGMCSYWISGGWEDDMFSRDRGWRVGTLDSELLGELEQAFPLEFLHQLADCPEMAGVFDANIRTIRSARSTASCRTNGLLFDSAWNAVATRASVLWARATPLDGGIRVSAIQTSGLGLKYPWPAHEPLSSFVIPEAPEAVYQGFSSGISRLVVDPAIAGQLRLARESFFIDSVATGTFADGQKMFDGTYSAFVFMRDALPYEDDHGLLPFSTGQ